MLLNVTVNFDEACLISDAALAAMRSLNSDWSGHHGTRLTTIQIDVPDVIDLSGYEYPELLGVPCACYDLPWGIPVLTDEEERLFQINEDDALTPHGWSHV